MHFYHFHCYYLDWKPLKYRDKWHTKHFEVVSTFSRTSHVCTELPNGGYILIFLEQVEVVFLIGERGLSSEKKLNFKHEIAIQKQPIFEINLFVADQLRNV